MGWFSRNREVPAPENTQEDNTQDTVEERNSDDGEKIVVEEVISENEKFRRDQEEKTRIKNSDDAYDEAHLINARYGETLKNYGEGAKFARIAGDEEQAQAFEKDATTAMEAASKAEAEKVNSIILESAKRNIGLTPFYGKPEEGGNFLWERLRKEDSHESEPFIPGKVGYFNSQDMEHLAGKINSKLEILKEPDGKGGFTEYPVVKLTDSAKEVTYITNGTGVEGDNTPRIFKMDKENMAQYGYETEDHDFRSIYPETKTNQEAE